MSQGKYSKSNLKEMTKMTKNLIISRLKAHI